MRQPPVVAAIVPCYNEAVAVSAVISELRRSVPGIEVYVYDNASTDATAEVARASGAVVRREPQRGKGNVIRRALADVEADIYLMVDGDDTYKASAAPELIAVLLDGGYDQVIGVRVAEEAAAYRSGHALGNRFFNAAVSRIFGYPVNDMLSGFRVFSRRFVKSFPAVSKTFEIETELTIHAVNNRMPQAEVPVGFRDRPAGSVSKLRTYHDGIRILRMILRLLHLERPLLVYSLLGALAVLLGLGLGLPVIVEYLGTGLVPRFPTAILAASVVLLGIMTLTIGVVLDGQRKIRQEASRLAYLALPAPPSRLGPT